MLNENVKCINLTLYSGYCKHSDVDEPMGFEEQIVFLISALLLFNKDSSEMIYCLAFSICPGGTEG
jgi:hypothetical protein